MYLWITTVRRLDVQFLNMVLTQLNIVCKLIPYPHTAGQMGKTMSLQELGFRFIHRDGGCKGWTHPAEVLPTDIDCTDMSDAEFTAAVLAQEAN